MKTCDVSSCKNTCKGGRKYCSAHAARLSRYGSLRVEVAIGEIYHGYAPKLKRSPTYNSWRGMVHRCTNPNAAKFKYYGGKGVKVWYRWLNFRNFLTDMGEKPTPKHTIGRKDANKNYHPSNCQWETWKEQAAAKRKAL